MHFWRFAEQHVERQIDRVIVELRIAYLEGSFAGGFTEHGINAAFALAQRNEIVEAFIFDGKHVALLAFVAPDFHW